MNATRITAYVLGALGGLVGGAVGALATRFYLGHRRVDQELASARYPTLKDAGSVKQLTILPLIDWYTARDELVGEEGVSYLVRADDTTILFDTGLNGGQEHPSPLLRNIAALGVDLTEVDAVVISHAHPDHLGGTSQMMSRTFALSAQPVELKGVPAYVPDRLTHPTARVVVLDGPQAIAPGIASTGPIARQMFFFGRTLEQSLAVHVEGKGIVVIIGCGHPTIQRILERAEMVFDAPIYGVVGGLHYPVTASRAKRLGLPMQRILGTGKWPWDPVNRQDVEAAIACLQRRRPQLVSLSAHDSCDWSIEAFRQAFGGAYHDLRVGEKIVVQ